MNKLLLVLFSSLSLCAMDSNKLVCMRNEAAALSTQKNRKLFVVSHEGKRHVVRPERLSKDLRELDNDVLVNALNAGHARLQIVEYSDGKYGFELRQGLKGGGPIGASIGVTIGRVGTLLIGHGIIHTTAVLAAIPAAAAGGPLAAMAAYGATAGTLEAAYGPTIELASHTIALAGGIAGGVLTGPA